MRVPEVARPEVTAPVARSVIETSVAPPVSHPSVVAAPAQIGLGLTQKAEIVGGGLTATAACSVTSEHPASPPAVRVYVVVEEGETVTEPEGPKLPTPAIVTPAAFGTFQLRVELPPGLMEEGDDVKLEAEAEGQTVTPTSAVGMAQAPLARRRYERVDAGVTTREPLAGRPEAMAAPVARSTMSTELAFAAAQESVVEPPEPTAEGEAVKLVID